MEKRNRSLKPPLITKVELQILNFYKKNDYEKKITITLIIIVIIIVVIIINFIIIIIVYWLPLMPTLFEALLDEENKL